jgi:hypothetical protein
MKRININNNENKLKVIGLLTILLFLWVVLYFIPDVINLLFNTFLGIIILLIASILTLMYNINYGIIVSILCIVLYRFSQLSKTKESFEWSQESSEDFLFIQHLMNPQKIFDVNIIQNQASQKEVDYFITNGFWPWTKKTIHLYKEFVNKNPYIRTYHEDAVNYARKIYNESAILQVMYNQSLEGQFLINGIIIQPDLPNKREDLPNGFGEYAFNSGLKQNTSNDIIKCNLSNNTLERTTNTGRGNIYGEQTSQISPIDYTRLENIIPGFSFTSSPCNPCNNINDNPYSCPFKINIMK